MRNFIIATFAAALALPLSAQGQPGRRGGGPPPERAQLENQYQQEMGRVVRQRLNLTTDQMTRLRDVDGRFEARRVQLMRDENLARRQLREIVDDTVSADRDKRASQALDRLLEIQRRRFDILTDEQKELSGFLTGVQRAKYHAIQEQLRRRIDDVRATPPTGPKPKTAAGAGRRGGPPPPA